MAGYAGAFKWVPDHPWCVNDSVIPMTMGVIPRFEHWTRSARSKSWTYGEESSSTSRSGQTTFNSMSGSCWVLCSLQNRVCSRYARYANRVCSFRCWWNRPSDFRSASACTIASTQTSVVMVVLLPVSSVSHVSSSSYSDPDWGWGTCVPWP